MKSRVDIFRPLAAAKRGMGESTSSIFRRNHPQQTLQSQSPSKCNSEETEGFVVSVHPGQWPPQALASSASEGTAQHKKLQPSAPLPTGTGSSSERTSSPVCASRKSASAKQECDDDDNDKVVIPPVTPPPSYYKIELVPGEDNIDGLVQLTAGDDSSVQLSPDHNERLQLVSNTTLDRSARQHQHTSIIRASPVIEHEGIEAQEDGIVTTTSSHSISKKAFRDESSQRWTISDKGNIIIIPPSPSRVSNTHFKKPRHPASPGGGGGGGGDDNSIPPLLLKASGSSDDSFVSTDNSANDLHRNICDAAGLASGGSESLESPPRMNRSLVTPSLFQDSVSSKASSNDPLDNINPYQNNISSSTHSKKGIWCGAGGRRSRSNSPAGGRTGGTQGGCGTRFDFLSQILDVFSLNGACCHQSNSACA